MSEAGRPRRQTAFGRLALVVVPLIFLGYFFLFPLAVTFCHPSQRTSRIQSPATKLRKFRSICNSTKLFSEL